MSGRNTCLNQLFFRLGVNHTGGNAEEEGREDVVGANRGRPGSAAASEAGGQEVGKDDLGYDVPVTVEDVPIVEGRSEVERLLQIEAKAWRGTFSRTRGRMSV